MHVECGQFSLHPLWGTGLTFKVLLERVELVPELVHFDRQLIRSEGEKEEKQNTGKIQQSRPSVNTTERGERKEA